MTARCLATLASLFLTAAAAAQAPPAADTTADSTADTMSIRRVSQLLAGHAGVLVSAIPGSAGAGARLRIRGPQTLIDSRVPLILVDGIRIDAAASAFGIQSAVTGMPRLDDFSGADVARLEVIPGPAAAGRYGPDAANGVVLIETRAGAIGAGPARWHVTMGATAKSRFDDWPTYVAGIDADNASAAFRNGGCRVALQAEGACMLDSTYAFDPRVARRQFHGDWRQEYGLQVHGGNERMGYYVSADVERAGGIVRLAPQEAARLTAAGQSLDATVLRPDQTQRSRIRANLVIRPFSDLEVQFRGQRFLGDQRVLPLEPLSNASRFECCAPNSDSVATSIAQLFNRVRVEELGRWTGSVQARWRAFPGLTFRAVGGHDAPDQNGRSTQPGTAVYISEDAFEVNTWSSEVGADYDVTLSPGVRWHTSAGIQHVIQRGRYFGRAQLGIPIEAAVESTSYNRRRETGLFASQQIVLDDALDLTLGVRHDIFRAFNAWAPSATHPNLALSWLAVPPRTTGGASLRLRAAYGSAGRRPLTAGEYPERTTEITAGLDAVAFDGRATLGATLYDMRSDVNPLPLGSVFFFPPASSLRIGGLVRNRGIEIAFSGRVIETRAAGLDLRLTAWGNRNRLERLDVPPYLAGAFASQGFLPGYPVGTYFGVLTVPFTDLNGDGLLGPSEVAAGVTSPAGTPYPTQGATLGLGLRLGRSVRVAGLLEYRAGNQLLNWSELVRCTSSCRESVDPTTPLPEQAQLVFTQVTSRFLEDADFLKLRSLSLTVDAPRTWLRFLRARGAAISLTGRNLATWTAYSYGDPETFVPDPAVGSLEIIQGRFLVPPLREWSLQVHLTY
jgi:hypothetical protein